jgi:hypothetical protein
MVLDVCKCVVILASGTFGHPRQRHCIVPAPYVNKYGETDPGFK